MSDTLSKTEVYEVPIYRLLASDEYAIICSDILDELGLTDEAKNMSTWTEYEESIPNAKSYGAKLFLDYLGQKRVKESNSLELKSMKLAGKSTLMKILSGVYTKDSESLKVFGNEID